MLLHPHIVSGVGTAIVSLVMACLHAYHSDLALRFSAWLTPAGYTLRQGSDPVLRQTAAPVETITPETRALIEGMQRLLAKRTWGAMAANQVGALKQIFILKRPGPDGQTFHQVFINPRITWESEAETTTPERCLSFPGLVKNIRRARRITVEARDIRFQPFTMNADDLPARIIQHEIDHLHGVVIADD